MTDDRPQVRHDVALAVDMATWLRDGGQWFDSRHASHHDPGWSPPTLLGLSARVSSPLVRACPLRCRIRPYWIKAAPLRSAAPGHARTGLRPPGADPGDGPGNERASTDRGRLTVRADNMSEGVNRLPRLVSVPVAATASRAPTASHAIATRPLTRRPLIRDLAPARKKGRDQKDQQRRGCHALVIAPEVNQFTKVNARTTALSASG
jgi:hypothetical protein